MERVLFTGLGSIGRRHVRLLHANFEDIEIHAYRSGESNNKLDINVNEHQELESALSTQPDIAFITNPTYKHVETALACAREDCHLFIEKPLSHSEDGIDKLIDMCQKKNLITYVGCQLRFHPVLRRIQSLLNEKVIGDVFSYRLYAGSYLPEWRPNQDYRASYSSDPKKGGGVILDLIHEIDYSYWLFGGVSNVQAWAGNVSKLEIESEDLAEIILEMDSGVVGQVHLDYYRPEPRRKVEIVGEEGILSGDLNTGKLTLNAGELTRKITFEFERDDLFTDQLKYFLNHVSDNEPCENDLREAKNVLNIALQTKGEV